MTLLCHSLVDWMGAADTVFWISSGRLIRVESINVLAILSYCGPDDTMAVGGRLMKDCCCGCCWGCCC